MIFDSVLPMEFGFSARSTTFRSSEYFQQEWSEEDEFTFDLRSIEPICLCSKDVVDGIKHNDIYFQCEESQKSPREIFWLQSYRNTGAIPSPASFHRIQ